MQDSVMVKLDMRKTHVIRLTESDSVELAARIRAARITAGQTQAELAAALGVSPTAVSRLESASRTVGLLEAVVISENLGVPLQDLLPHRLQSLVRAE